MADHESFLLLMVDEEATLAAMGVPAREMRDALDAAIAAYRTAARRGRPSQVKAAKKAADAELERCIAAVAKVSGVKGGY